LQGNGRGGNHHGGVVRHGVPDGRHQVGQRLASAGAGLHGQVLALLQRGAHRPHHPLLPFSGLPADRLHGGAEHLVHARQVDPVGWVESAWRSSSARHVTLQRHHVKAGTPA